MTPILFQRSTAIMLLISGLAVNGAFSFHTRPRIAEAEHIDEACPPCDLLFSKLETSESGGKLSQFVKVQERGEPKSGTGMMYSWATAALIHACDYLQEVFGEGCCRFDHTTPNVNIVEPLDRFPGRSIVFQPSLGSSDSRCSCETIDRDGCAVTSCAVRCCCACGRWPKTTCSCVKETWPTKHNKLNDLNKKAHGQATQERVVEVRALEVKRGVTGTRSK